MLTFDEAYKIAANLNKKRSYKKISDIRDVGDGWLFGNDDGIYGNWPIYVNKETGDSDIFVLNNIDNIIRYRNAKKIVFQNN